MREIYRKRGCSVRWENGTTIRIHESGVAIETDDLFTCHPDAGLASALPRFRRASWEAGFDGATRSTGTLAGDSLSEMASRVESTAGAIRVPENVRIERLIVSEGEAEHTFRDREWRDATVRIHLALARSNLRVLIDLADFDIDCIAPIADALARCEESEREAPPCLRLAPNVVAALLPSLPAVAQRAGGIDGKGNPIDDATEPWPNWYRPSYRARPVRMPFNLTATADAAEIDESLPHAVALLGPSQMLIVDGERAYRATVRVARLDAVSPPLRWYPYGAGAWGAHAVARPA